MTSRNVEPIAAAEVGIVLGAGGSLGWAYHLGVVEALRDVLGIELDQAARVIGTSAGSAISASVMAGADSEEILAAINRPVPPEVQEQMRLANAERQSRGFLRRYLRPQSLSMLRAGGLIGLSGLAPAGLFPTVGLRRFPAVGLSHWPDNLWLPAVRLGDGAVVVFGRDRQDLPVIDAVEASSAVPALFQPKSVGEHRFLDGAIASASHADLLVSSAPKLVIIASPMTRPGRGPIRQRARWQLRKETRALQERGCQVITVQPDEVTMAVADGYPRTRPEAGPAIVDQARKQATVALRPLT